MSGPFTRGQKLDLYYDAQFDAPVSYSPPIGERFLPNAERIALAGRGLAKY